MSQLNQTDLKIESKSPVRVAIVYHSDGGSTKNVAYSIAKGIANVDGVTADIFTADEAGDKVTEIAEYDAFVFGSPTYFGSISAKLKAFFEKTSSLFVSRQFQDKLVGGFTNSASISGDKQSTLLQIFTFAAQQGLIWVPLGQLPTNNKSEFNSEAQNRGGYFSGVATQSYRDADPHSQPDQAELDTAIFYGEKLAKVALQYYK